MSNLFKNTLVISKSRGRVPAQTTTDSRMAFAAAKTKRPFRPDFSNQLDLFGSLASDAVLEVTASGHIPQPETIDARKQPVIPDDPEPLAGTLSAHGGGAASAESSGERLGGSGGTDSGSSVRTDVGPEAAVSGGVGDSDAGVGIPADRGPPAVVRRADHHIAEERPSRDFRITDAHRIGEGGLHEKARDNLAAIQTLKLLETENREATDAEKSALARYAGWGALPNAFHPFPPAEWKVIAKDVRQLLADEEYTSARASTPNAHFTSPMVIGGIWDGMQRLGLKDQAQILEPSMGVGHFFGLMPPALLSGSKRTGVELDHVTALIAKKLYPDATVFAKGFEDTPLPDHFFDAIVGNVPFGDFGVHDPAYKRPQTRAIHDYFFAKSIDKLRPGGVMALITSRYTMDKQDSSMRRYLADRADLIGAIRLPNTAFKANAGTEVTTDILFLQKRPPGKAASGPAWTELGSIDTADGEIAVNEYYARHPQMMLGGHEARRHDVPGCRADAHRRSYPRPAFARRSVTP